MDKKITIDRMLPEDWEQVKDIYQEGILTGNATFQKEPPSWEEWDNSHLTKCRLVARSEDTVLGWTALSAYSGRCVYAGVAELSIYIRTNLRGKGIGKALITELIKSSEEHGIWTLQAGIFPENSASLSLHEKFGFRVIGRRERIGKMAGRWRDVILLERRSKISGVD
ncbi:phosphinothricin acetyltransferase [Evansella caseinilytica]|uniref:Phosphinothricin acetyltransferase n=1 Tax=Evansella caseinilytica TaxID=1503961 RepID=A0A1H3HTP1_9BACI|nr:GNAT family N-acetyltransferase [Evansella caseinilytica]SDY18802.1 phosphinothricin acetyltransferase [Evansella caseinilytica]